MLTVPEEHAQQGLVKRTGRNAPDLVHLQASGDSGWSLMCNNNNGALIYRQEKTTLLPSVNIISLRLFCGATYTRDTFTPVTTQH